jgi:hypothetical protein
MMADECHQSRLVALMSTGYPPGDHVRTISAAPLRTIAVQRISLDMDDGRKVNYGKFGGLLDSVKVVTGGVRNE